MKLIIANAGIQVVAFTLVSPAKFINAQSAAGAADWCLVVQYQDRFIETDTLLACSVSRRKRLRMVAAGPRAKAH
jgi:hypothetical protein